MTAITLPGQLELDTVVCLISKDTAVELAAMMEEIAPYEIRQSGCSAQKAVMIAKLLRSYEERPTSETWARIQSLAAEILR